MMRDDGRQPEVWMRGLLPGYPPLLQLEQVCHTPESSLTEVRGVGRAQLPSTVIGLLFHAAEHTLRHVGQMVTTIRIVRRR